MIRKSKRTTAGTLPKRFDDDLTADIPPTFIKRNLLENMSSQLPHSSPHVTTSQVRPKSARPRGRPRIRNLPPKKTEEQNTVYDSSEEGIAYPQAAFPTLGSPMAKTQAFKAEKAVGKMKRDSMDLRLSPVKDQAKLEQQGEVKLPNVRRYFDEGRWIDLDGSTLHGLAAYYDKHAEEYETENKDKEGDSKARNRAFEKFIDTNEAAQASHLGGKAGVMTAFEKWFNAGGARAYAMSNGLEDEQRTIKDFKDEQFASLHIRLQWCMITEIEEDLARYPPRNVPQDATPKTYRYVRNILGISNSFVLRSMEKKVEETKNKAEEMPSKADYIQACTYLQGKGLPATLIEMYNYLEDAR